MRSHYDRVGGQEWSRLTEDVAGRVSLEVHRRFLRRFVRPGSRVLEIGAGPGRFTLELAALDCRIVVTDLSAVQLDLNAAQLAGTAADTRVQRRELLDVCDTSRYDDHEFDAVVAFGGPLSYAFEQVGDAMRGLLRIVARDGAVVASVMSLLGTWRHSLPAVIALAQTVGEDANDAVLRTGDLRHVVPESKRSSTGPAASSSIRAPATRSTLGHHARPGGGTNGCDVACTGCGTSRPVRMSTWWRPGCHFGKRGRSYPTTARWSCTGCRT